MALSLRKTIVVFVVIYALDIDIPVMQKQMQISESRVAKRCERRRKKGRRDVKYVGNVADDVNILLAIQDWKLETASNQNSDKNRTMGL
jgi:hypothetical protein